MAAGKRSAARLAAAVFVLSALIMPASGCFGGKTPLQTAVVAETAAVQGIHAVVGAEAAAYAAKAYPQAQHDKYLLVLRKVLATEKALNDALLVWARNPDAPAPVLVVQAAHALNGILADLAPLIPANSNIGVLASSIIAAVGQLTGGA